jgi:lysine 2,3-aminomutase
MSHVTNKPKKQARAAEQPYKYPPELPPAERDWRRFPGWRDVSREQWETALWQRQHSIKSLKELKAVMGGLLPDDLAESIEKDQREMATMAILIPPHLLNTMNEEDLWKDPVRRYMLPARKDRHPEWPNHPLATRDSLHESEMWVVEGLTHRYPTKVLAELLSTCPQYCGHCTRMDLVGSDVPQVSKGGFTMQPAQRYEAILEYLRKTPSVRDVVVSGGDVANLPIARLEGFVSKLMDIPNIRDIRLASKGLMAIPHHFLQGEVLRGLERLAKKARERDIDIALHTHINHASQVTPLLAKAVRQILDMGFRDVRNQGVLMRGVNATAKDLLDLGFALVDRGRIMPYYFYMCDMIPNSEHWRLSVREAQEIQHDIMGYLPGFATPRVTCDVPRVGKRWITQWQEYDREKGITYWTKNYRTSIEADDPEALGRRYEYYDPVYTLPPAGREYWRKKLKG